MFYIHPCFEKYIQRLASLSPQCYIINNFSLQKKKYKNNFNRRSLIIPSTERWNKKLPFINSAFIPTVF